MLVYTIVILWLYFVYTCVPINLKNKIRMKYNIATIMGVLVLVFILLFAFQANS
jgi:hypothetical protein